MPKCRCTGTKRASATAACPRGEWAWWHAARAAGSLWRWPGFLTLPQPACPAGPRAPAGDCSRCGRPQRQGHVDDQGIPPRSTPASHPRPVAAVVQLRRRPGELPDTEVICSHSRPPLSPSACGPGEAVPMTSALHSGVLVLPALAGVALLARVRRDDRLHRCHGRGCNAHAGNAFFGVASPRRWPPATRQRRPAQATRPRVAARGRHGAACGLPGCGAESAGLPAPHAPGVPSAIGGAMRGSDPQPPAQRDTAWLLHSAMVWALTGAVMTAAGRPLWHGVGVVLMVLGFGVVGWVVRRLPRGQPPPQPIHAEETGDGEPRAGRRGGRHRRVGAGRAGNGGGADLPPTTSSPSDRSSRLQQRGA